MKHPKGHVGLAIDRTCDVVPKRGRHGNCGSEWIGPKKRALCQNVGQVVAASAPVRKAGEVNTGRIERIGILRLKRLEYILDGRRGGITCPVGAVWLLRRDEKTGIVRLVVGVGGADQGQGTMGIIDARAFLTELKDVVRATFSVTVQEDDSGVLDGGIEVLGKKVPIGITCAINVRRLPHRID